MAQTYLTVAEFQKFRENEFQPFRDEFQKFRENEFQPFRDEFISFRDEVKTEFSNVHGEIQVLKTDVNELKVTTLQMAARARNSHLKNPTLLIRSIPIPHPDRGIVEPDPANFPRHANEFYGLREPLTERHHRMLAYLVGFYDIAQEASGLEGSSYEETQLDPECAVELLEDILGLQEDNFIAFREKARQFASQPAKTAAKREPLSASGQGLPQRRKVQPPSDDGTPTNLNTPSPPGGRPPRRQVFAAPLAPLSSVSSHNGSTTNPNTPPAPPNPPKPESLPKAKSVSNPKLASKSSLPDTEVSLPDTDLT